MPELILAIESSCDETSVAIVADGRRVLSMATASSLKDFTLTGGVIPEYAARRQLEMITPTLDQALRDSSASPGDLECIAVTKGPGLLGSLLVGTSTARVLSSIWNKPLIGVHHTLGHLYSTWLLPRGEAPASPEPIFPLLVLSVSGGHTDLWLLTGHCHGVLLGSTKDDAAGEAFDKGASLLGLGYPGGPALAKLAQTGNEYHHHFPSPLKQEQSLDFSFSGLKTALKYLLAERKNEHTKIPQSETADIAASYQLTICRHLADRVERALAIHSDIHELHVVGGVSANIRLRSLLGDLCKKRGIELRLPAEFTYCTDNAAMIGCAAHYLLQANKASEDFVTEATIDLQTVISR